MESLELLAGDLELNTRISWRFGIKYPILMAGKSKLFILILPIYYLFTLWFVLILMWLDVKTDNKEGTGILLVAEKV